MMSSSVGAPGSGSMPITLTMGEINPEATTSAQQLQQMRAHILVINDPTAKDEAKLQAAQQISDSLDLILTSPEYPAFLNQSLGVFRKFLREGSPHFIAEQHAHQVRKLVLEIIQRLPVTDHLKPHTPSILLLAFELLKTENEENVVVCLKIIIELHKQFRPQHSTEITHFLQFVKSIYKELPNHMNKIFEPKEPLKINDLSELNIEAVLDETFTITPISTGKKSATDSGTTHVTYNLIPKAVLSLKVLQELPIIVVLMYQLYKQYVHQEVSEFIPLIMNTITLQPNEAQRLHKNFNREVFVDFMGAQIKTLSFLAYIIRLYQEVVSTHSTLMVKGILSLLTVCPHEVAHLRKELLIGARHILTTELRTKFVPHMEKLFDEDILLGKGWTTHESLRPLAYSTLADLVHHVRQSLPLSDLARAVSLFSKNVHDESLPTSIQTMSCKLLLNLVECIKARSEKENAINTGKDLLMQMNEVFVLKFKTVAKLQLPVLMAKHKSLQQQQLQAQQQLQHPQPPSTPTTPSTPCSESMIKSENIDKPDVKAEDSAITLSPEKKAKFGFPASQAQNYTVADCRALVKTLVCGVKTITWGLTSAKTEAAVVTAANQPPIVASPAAAVNTQFQPKETLVYIRLVKWAMEALDVYTLNTTPGTGPAVTTVQPSASGVGGAPKAQPLQQTVRTKEEKEVLEHFAGALSLLNPQTFREVFTETIDFVVERIYKNYALQIMANSFLANNVPSPIFATILVEYLLERMHEMGSNMERSNLYLKLFKLVFGSVSLFAAENEQMLKPHLHSIVNKSMELAKSAKEPYNYFLLLRALFRSIGGGSHDLLYQEFLPLLPNLLQGLNSLQSGLHKQHMKDLFVELCLTVPVRLSSLLPYLPMLMDPLVSALNGSQTLVNQGLRTLELCVDNLQPDFLYEHIQPVRAELMQALWRTLRNQNDQIAHVAFRVLGKFGGGNRKMMIEPQALEYKNTEDTAGPCFTIYFPEHKDPISLPVKKVIETAFNALKSSSTEPGFYRKQCWEVIKSYLVASLQLDDDKSTLLKLLAHPSFREGPINSILGPQYRCSDKQARSVHQMAVTGMFVAAAIKELRQAVLPTMVALVRHYTMVAIAQQAGPFPMYNKQSKLSGMDPLVLIDAMAVIMGHEEKELCKPGHLAMVLILDTATNILGSKERACRLPIMETLAEKMCALCYERAWYSKLGGCIAIKFLFERMDLRWVFQHQFSFLKALLFVMMDSTGEVSSGAVDMAKSNLEKMLQLCATPLDETTAHLKEVQDKSLADVIHELVRQVTSPNSFVREQAMNSLKILAEITNTPVTEVMAPHKDVLQDMIPPKKHLLRHQPVNAQIGLMDGNTFCTTLEPRLFTIDLKIMEHKVFFTELLSLCEADDASLQKLPCYKTFSDLVPLRKSALRALAACHYIPECREKIFQVLFRALNNANKELVEAGFECMKKFLEGHSMETESVATMSRNLATTVQDFRNINPNLLLRLNYLAQLFPAAFNDTKICEHLLSDLRKWLEQAIVAYKQHLQGNNKTVGQQQLKVAADILKLYIQIPITLPVNTLIDMLCKLVLTTEKTMSMEPGSILRVPLMGALARFPNETIDYFISENQSRDSKASRFMSFMLAHSSPEGQLIRNSLKAKTDKLVNLLGSAHNQMMTKPDETIPILAEIQFSCIRVVYIMSKMDPDWTREQPGLITTLRTIWNQDCYHDKFHHGDHQRVDYSHWKEPKLIVKVLLEYFKMFPDTEILLLFQLMRALCGRFVADFQFLKDYVEHEVCYKFSVDWKRAAFFEFIRLWKIDNSLSQDLKAKILQYIIIPMFANSFEKGETDAIIGGPPAPETDSEDNVVSSFICNIIETGDAHPTSDAVRILLLQFSCLLVDEGAAHIHNAGNKKQEGTKLRKLMTYAWPCLLQKNCVDPATRYHGHLLLSHIIAKFAIHKRIVLQVFHSLLKAHAVEARNVVRQALEILTPSMPGRMEDGNTMLTHWTKKIILEEGHTGSQLVHILQLVVKHYKVYYPVRHHLIQYIVSPIQRLGFNAAATIEQKKLAVDLCEIAIKWEVQRVRDDFVGISNSEDALLGIVGVKRPPASDVVIDPAKRMAKVSVAAPNSGGSVSVANGASLDGQNKPLNKIHSDSIVNYLLRLACQVGDIGGQPGAAAAAGPTQGEMLSRRCVALLKSALKPDIWGNCDLKLQAFDKILDGQQGVASTAPNLANICTCLDIMSFLLTVLRKDQILAAFKPLQKAIAQCMRSNNSKVIRAVHTLMSRLMTQFPTEPTNSPVASKHEELTQLYASVGTVIQDGLGIFERNLQAPPASLFGTLMMLKAACISNACYIDRLISTFMRVLERLAKEHLRPTTQDNTAAASELLILSLDLVKNRVAVMGQDIRKAFIGTILVGLIEKSTDVKVMKAITKMLEDWMKNKDVKMMNQGPNLKEKSILLVKMMQYVEKRFPEDAELNGQFLELINYVYRDENLKNTELTSKLEPAFLSGLRCTQPHIRAKFFEVFDTSMRKRLNDRLLYIVCSQNWESMGPHYWIKQCLELVLSTASAATPVTNCSPTSHLPSVTSVINAADPNERNEFTLLSMIKEEPMMMMDSEDERVPVVDELADIELASNKEQRTSSLNQLIAKQYKFLESAREHRTVHFLSAMCQLAHMEASLAEDVWLNFFPSVWQILSEKQREALSNELVPFICSGAHLLQRDCQPSALNTFVEAVSRCRPIVEIKPTLLKYLGKSHNLWHRSTLLLEKLAEEDDEAMDALSEMYSLLKEEDMWAGLWQKKAKYQETNIAIAYEQQGYFEQAQGAYELAMSKYRNDYNNGASPVALQQEIKLWEEHWLRSSKELNQWEILLEYGTSKGVTNPFLVLESAWHKPAWPLVKDALSQVELGCPKELGWKLHLFRGYLAICNPTEDNLVATNALQLQQPLNTVDRFVDLSSNHCIKEWRRLPNIVSHVHLTYLQAAQQVMELQEAAQIHKGLSQGHQNSHHDMKAIVKTWRNRLPVISDDLSHWSEIFTWRQHHYKFIASHYNSEGQKAANDQQASSHSMLGVHASAQAIIHFGKIARKHNLTSVCVDSLSKIYTIASVPIVDCFQKIRQQVKCYVQTAATLGKNELQEGLDVIESTNLKYFTKQMTAEFYALKGMLQAQIGKSDEANKAFSAAVQMHDTLVKAWALWGEYLETVFTKEPSAKTRNIRHGVEAIICYLHACRHQDESKSRKYLAKVIWLLTYDDEKLALADAVDKYNVGVPPIQWLPWIPQLLTCLVRNEGKLIINNLLSNVGRMFPQAVYFPIRTLYLTLKIEQRERFKAGSGEVISGAVSERRSSDSPSQDSSSQGGQNVTSNEQGPIKATVPMWRCSRIMHMQRDLHPTVLSSLEGIVDQMVWFRENWYEEVLRQLRQGLAKCYVIAFDNMGGVTDATITPHTLNFVKKLVATFGIGIENFGNTAYTTGSSSAANESLVRRAQASQQDPVFQKMKSEFTSSFDFSAPNANNLQNLIQKLKKWIKILEAKTRTLPKSFLIEEKCRFLSNFSRQTAEVELPGELLLPKHSHYQVYIQRFMPRVEIVQKHNAAARRLYIRGHNGKIYPYLVISDSGLADARREERVLQLIRMMNHMLGKHKETSKRFLNFTVPRVVAVSPQMRLVEDNPSSISLLDIYKNRCVKQGLDHDNPIARYYERLATVQARGGQASQQVLREILKEVQNTMVPKTMLKDWASQSFASATDYWTFRKMFTLQLALAAFAEYVLHLARLNPDMMYIHQDSGLVNISYFKFDVDDVSGKLDSNRPVPFRMTPNITEFVTPVGVAGPLTASMISAARCFVQPSFKIASILRAVLRDEMIAWNKKNGANNANAAGNSPANSDAAAANAELENRDRELIISLVTKAVTVITQRLTSLSAFDGVDSKVGTLVATAKSHDNLCRMDPAWHPWL